MKDEPFSGEEMTCCVCGKVEQSDPAVKSGWRAIEVDHVRHYVCPAEFPADGSNAGQFELAYKRVMKVILEKVPPKWVHGTAGTEGTKVRKCRKCGCTEERACLQDGRRCHWVLPDLCSACVPKRLNDRDVRHLKKVDIGVRFNGPEAFAVLTALQLALQHPSYPAGPSRAVVTGVAQWLAQHVSVTENLTAVAAAGFVPNAPLIGEDDEG